MGTKVSSSSSSTSSPAVPSPLQSSSRFWSMSCIPSRRTNQNSVANKQEVKYNTTKQSVDQNNIMDSHMNKKRSTSKPETKFCNLHLRTYTRVPINTLITYEEYRLPSHTLYLEHIPILLQDIEYVWNKLLNVDDNDDSSSTMTNNPVILPSTIAQYKANAEMYINKFVASGKYEKCLKQLYKKNRTHTGKTSCNQVKKSYNNDDNSLQEKEIANVINDGNSFTTKDNNNIVEEEENFFLQRPFVLLLYKTTTNNNHMSCSNNNFNKNFYNKKVKKLFSKSKNGAATPKLTAVHLLSLVEMFLWNLPEPLIPFLISRQMENAMMHTSSANYGGCTLAKQEIGNNREENDTNKTLEENNKLEGKSSQRTKSEKQREQSSEEQQQVKISLVNDKKDIKEWQGTSAWKEFANESSLYVNSYLTYCFIMAMLHRHIDEITRHEVECILQAMFHDASGECKHVICALLNECKPTTFIRSTVKYSKHVENTETDKIEQSTRRTSDSMLKNNESVNATMGIDNDVNNVAVQNTESKRVRHVDNDNDNSERKKYHVEYNKINAIKGDEADKTDDNLSTSETSNLDSSNSSVVSEVGKFASNVANNNNNGKPCKEDNQIANKSNSVKMNEDTYSQTKKLSSSQTTQHNNIEEKEESENLLNYEENELNKENTKSHQESVQEHENEETVLCAATNVKDEQTKVHQGDKMSKSSAATESSSTSTPVLLPENSPGNENKAPDHANVSNKDNECNEQTASELHSDEFVKIKTEQVQTITTPIINKLATFADEDKETFDNHHNQNNNSNIDNNNTNNTLKVKTGSSLSTNDTSKEKGNDETNSNSPIHRAHCRMTSDTMLSSRLLEHISPVKQIPHMNTNVSIEGEEEQQLEEEEEPEEEEHELLNKKELKKCQEECELEHLELKQIEPLQQRVSLLEQKRKEQEYQELKEIQENISERNQQRSPEDTETHAKEQLSTEHKKLINTTINSKEQSSLRRNEENHHHHHHHHNATKLSTNANKTPLSHYDKETEGKQHKRKQSERVKKQTLSQERKIMSTANEHKYRKGFAKMSDMHKMYTALQALEYAKHKFLISDAPLSSKQTATIKTKTNMSATQSNAMLHAINSERRAKKGEGEDVAENWEEANSINTQMPSLHKDNSKNIKICRPTCTPEAVNSVNSNKQQELEEINKSVQVANTHKCNSFATLEQEEKVNALLEQLVNLQQKLSSDLARHANNTERDQSLLLKDKDARFADLELRFAKMNKLLTAQVEESRFAHEMLERLQVNMQKKRYIRQANELINTYN